MLKYIDNIPNNYIYTSHTGSEYVFLEGKWYNCKTMIMVETSKNHKMNNAAKIQINEHNNDSSLKIGKSYKICGNECMYIGRGNCTINNKLITEQKINNSLCVLMENVNNVPDGYVYISNKNKSYYKKKGIWYSSETKQPINSTSAIPLERAAVNKIQKYNEDNSVKIGEEWTSSKGVTYKYVGGNRFISENGKLLPLDLAKKILDKLTNERTTIDTDDTQTNNDTTQSNDPNGTNGTDGTDGTNGTDGTDDSTDSTLKNLANSIKSNPEARRIIVLLSRGDDISLLAADILLSGKQKEFAQIINSLNNKD